MWTCPKCLRNFQKNQQPHSCHSLAISEHFINKPLAKGLFRQLLKRIGAKIGKCRVISLPCCIHLFGSYDFLAALPKRDRLEIRFGLPRALKDRRVKVSVRVSKNVYKNCLDLKSADDIDRELISWLREAYGKK